MGTFDEYIEGWRERARRDERRRQEREQAARALVPTLVAHLVERFAPSRVWLVGSLVEGGFDERSDIDLLVEGIEGAAIYRAGAELDELAGGMAVDLIPLEDAYDEVAQKLTRSGELLHAE